MAARHNIASTTLSAQHRNTNTGFAGPRRCLLIRHSVQAAELTVFALD